MRGLFEVAIVIFFALMAGNFLFQAIMNQQWHVALERSFFQLFAIAIFAFALRRRKLA